jgi:hypothetical protein
MADCHSFYETLTVGALVIGAVSYIAKLTISTLLKRDVISYKADLDQRTATALEGYRAALEKENLRMQISYGGIFEKQAEAILTLFKLLARFESQMRLAAHIGAGDSEYPKFIETWRQLIETYEEQQILLPAEVDRQFGEIAKMIFVAVHDVRRADDRMEKVGHTLSSDQIDRLFASQDRAYEIIEKVPELKEELKLQLRKIIGINHANEAPASDT